MLPHSDSYYICHDIDINNKKKSNNDGNSSNRVFQIDGECTVFRLSTLNDKKERNNIDAFTLHVLLKSTNDNWNVLITYGNCFLHDKCIINTIVLIIDTSVLTLLSKLLINHYKFVSRKADDINDNSKTD